MTATEFKAWRLSLNLTRRQAAALLGCAFRTVQGWEQGRTIPEHWGRAMRFISDYRAVLMPSAKADGIKTS